MKKLIRPFLLAFAKRLLDLLRQAESEDLKSKFKFCGRDVDLYFPVCILEPGNVSLGDKVAIGAFVHMWGHGGIRIGDRVMIGSHAALTTLTHEYSRECMQATLLQKQIIIENDVWLGAHCVIMPGITVGKGAVVGAGSVVTKNVEPYAIVVGVPARLLKYREIHKPAEK